MVAAHKWYNAGSSDFGATVSEAPTSELETDPRFPSGRWTGFYLDKRVRGKQQMELLLAFRCGEMTGEGRDPIAAFVIRGRYSLEDGQCHWHKRYVGAHDVYYKG